MSAKQILVIDDEDDIRKLTQICLETMGDWHVFTANSGSEGLAMAEANQPDAILLDMMMPDMDGAATFEKLKANPATKDIPVIILTARGRAANQNFVKTLDIKGVISKPFNPLKLAEQVAKALS
ncbi:response regulator [Aetokthonos hydrillicola Thurmond2011]|uniref:Response regulator n=1 Tax=Aetokthonos hydrillicola Thurmond2011 TaxID=2712845 RepID=A0AAP5IA51_9CYAN|nr:response regulator [Aetokthonos hydrillicola]MBO3461592.1 response regulator [Aetokthonos hydrillicola CCALA 1050]MBW4586106.1 response regulator [Aetokthonos hydrillicola CCALA 1050]MDR9897713.1 response regulator [Aetokthonos hydrillicola Thurmond2011]